MSRKLERTVIDGMTYEIGQWPVDKSLDMLTWLTKTLGESFASLSSGAVNMEDLMDKEIADVLGPAIRSLIPRLNEQEVKDRAREIVDDVLCNGKKIAYDVHFMGRIGHLFKVIVEVLKVQYADFLGALTDKKPRVKAVVREEATTQAR